MKTEQILISVRPADINFVNRVMEGYEHLGMVSTLDRSQGKLIIRVTPDTYTDVLHILQHLPMPIQFDNAQKTPQN